MNALSNLETALRLAARDHLYVFPGLIRGRQKFSYTSAKYSNGRRWGNTSDPALIREYYERFPEALVGVACGNDSRMFVTETDTKEGGHAANGAESLAALEAEHGKLPPTLQARSPSGSVHYYWRLPEGVEIFNSAGTFAPGIDVRGEGGMVIAPPSVRADGAYEWVNDLPIADAPQWVIDRAIAAGKAASGGTGSVAPSIDPETIEAPFEPADHAQRVLSDQYKRVAAMSEGGRNDRLNKAAYQAGRYVGNGELPEQLAVDILFKACRTNGLLNDDGEEACLKTIASGLAAGKKNPAKTVADMFPDIAQIAVNAGYTGMPVPTAPAGATVIQLAAWKALGLPPPPAPAPSVPLPQSGEESAVAKLNAQYAVVLNKGNVSVLKEGTKDGIDFLSIPAFRAWFSNRWVYCMRTNENGREVETAIRLADLWLHSAERRQYEGVEFSPTGKVQPGCYNLWTGWGVEAADISYEEAVGRCCLFLDHIFQNVCGGNVEHYNYVLAWFADIIQDPTNIKGVALVLPGLKGTGKSKVFEIMRKVIGRHSITVSHGSQLTGKFNAHLAAKMLIVAEESYWSGDRASEGALKNMITSRTATIEKKGVDAFEVDSFARVAMVTNNEWAVPASADERRYAVFRVGEARRMDHKYFAAIDAEMENGGYEALFTLLQKFPLHTVDLRKVPETGELRKQRERSLEPHDQFVRDMLYGMEVDGKGLGEAPILIAKQKVHDAYVEYSRERGKPHTLDHTQFCKKFVAATGANGNKRLPRDAYSKQSWAFELPPLADVRKHFSAFAKINVEE
jgi:Bifunctional DNA primase/polymerase, N-terminal/Family of unknown function (DUF5906)